MSLLSFAAFIALIESSPEQEWTSVFAGWRWTVAGLLFLLGTLLQLVYTFAE